MEIIERIHMLLKKENKRANVLCDLLGIRTSTMSTWKTRCVDPPARYMPTIADYLGVSLNYLLTGEEAPVAKTTTDDEDEMLALFRQLPVKKQYETIGEMKGFLNATGDTAKGKRLSASSGTGDAGNDAGNQAESGEASA